MPARPRTPQQAFASAALVDLLVRSLRRRAPELLPQDLRAPDALASATLPAGDKRRLLDFILDKGGAAPILAVGDSLHEVRSTPLLGILLASADSFVLAEKWMRLERYHHSSHRVRIEHTGPGVWDCRRQWIGDDAPSQGENLLILGLMRGILTVFGCVDVESRFGTTKAQDLPGMSASHWPPTDAWTLTWTEERIVRELPQPVDDSVMGRLRQLLNADVGRVWTVAEAARALRVGTRTLQRELKFANHSFTSMVRECRTHSAAHLLGNSCLSIADIGYACGYADQAHFTRDFKRALNVSPAIFRREAKT